MTLPPLHSIIAGLLGRTWVIALVAIVVCAHFVVTAVAALDGTELVGVADAAPPPVAVRPAAPARAHRDGSVLVTRNIFCSSCTPPLPGGPASATYTGEPAVLIATSLGIDPRATVRVLASEAQGSWGLGDRIPGVGRIDRIGAVSIDVVDVAGHRGRLSLTDGTVESRAAAGRVEAGAATPGPAAAADPFADRVKKLSDSAYEVDRQLVRDLVSGAAKANGARAIPVMKGGEVHGIRLLGVRGGSVASALGLKSNDVIAAIDGEPIKTMQQLLDLFARLDQLSAVELSGTRAGTPLKLTLHLR